MVHTTIVEEIKVALDAWFLVMHKKAAINYSEYNPETGKFSFMENFDKEDQGTK